MPPLRSPAAFGESPTGLTGFDIPELHEAPGGAIPIDLIPAGHGDVAAVGTEVREPEPSVPRRLENNAPVSTSQPVIRPWRTMGVMGSDLPGPMVATSRRPSVLRARPTTRKSTPCEMVRTTAPVPASQTVIARDVPSVPPSPTFSAAAILRPSRLKTGRFVTTS